MRVKTTGGSTWRISRRVLPWRRRIRAGHLVMDLLDILGFGSNSFRGGGGNLTDLPTPLAMLVLLVWLLVLIPALFLAALMAGELAIAGVILPFILAARFWFGVPWVVQVLGHRGRVHHEETAATWDSAGEQARALAARYVEIEDPNRPSAPVEDSDDEDLDDEDLDDGLDDDGLDDNGADPGKAAPTGATSKSRATGDRDGSR